MKNLRWVFILMLAAVAIFTFGGCGGDDPVPIDTGDPFDEATALAQIAEMASLAGDLVESIDTIADGVGAKNASFVWHPETMSWVSQESGSGDYWDRTSTHTLKYYDAEGAPRQFATDAVSAHSTVHSALNYTPLPAYLHYTFDHSLETFFGESSYRMSAEGGITLDSLNTQGEHHFVITWTTLGDGITTAPGGCPVGVFRFALAPYRLDVVFNGTATSIATLYDDSNGIVRSDTQDVSCGE